MKVRNFGSELKETMNLFQELIEKNFISLKSLLYNINKLSTLMTEIQI